jgi:hypothetical protein
MIICLEESRQSGSISAYISYVLTHLQWLIQFTDIHTFSHLGDLPEVYDCHIQAVDRLKSTENTLLKTAAKLHATNLKKEAKAAREFGTTTPTPGASTTDIAGQPFRHLSHGDPENRITLVEKLVPQKMRPTHRLPLHFMPFALPFVGKRVGYIHQARDDIVTMNDLLNKGRKLIQSESSEKALPIPTNPDSTISNDNMTLSEGYLVLNSAFITFNKQIAVHLAKTALNHRQPYRMAGRHTEVVPEDIIWAFLVSLPSYLRHMRYNDLYNCVVAFVSFVSNIHALCLQYSWLAWLCKLPSPVVSIIQGILPELPLMLLEVLMMLLPIILRCQNYSVYYFKMFITVMIDCLLSLKEFPRELAWNLA